LHFVFYVSSKFIESNESRPLGKPLPEIVNISPPRILRFEEGEILVAEQSILCLETPDATGICPFKSITIGINSPHSGLLSRVHSIDVPLITAFYSNLHVYRPKFIEVILLEFVGKLIPVIESFFVEAS
jgi:hypothetical protein